MPDTSGFEQKDAASKKLPKAVAPAAPSSLFQEKGSRPSKALPYRLHCTLNRIKATNQVQLVFENKGKKGAVYHVYDLKQLNKIPRRYTVEAGKSLKDEWDIAAHHGAYDLEVYGPNGYFHKFTGNIAHIEPEVQLQYNHTKGDIVILLANTTKAPINIEIKVNAYSYPSFTPVNLSPGKKQHLSLNLEKSGNWYDFTVFTSSGFSHRFAGRIETGRPAISDPAMASHLT
ncbi:Non-hemolytic phospholipase C [compost metagenome]